VDPRFLKADELGIRLEIVGGLPIWEAHPSPRHQRHVDRIRASIKAPSSRSKSRCACVHFSDIYVQFSDGSLKRPDISIFSREPEEQDDAVTLVPEAVIEVVSKGYEAKDLQIAPDFYLSRGVKDVVVFDPTTLLVLHVTAGGARRLTSTTQLTLLCGCRLTV
jgi:Uma2 family endonuclease